MKSFSAFIGRLGAFVLMSLMTVSAYAQALRTNSNEVCFGEPVVLSISNFGSGAVFVYKSEDGGNSFKKVASSGADKTGTITYVENMQREVVYYFEDQKNSSLKTSPVKITLKSNCKEVCHTTTTGEYYLGTDFNPTNGCNENQIDFNSLNCLENHFRTNGITFRGCVGSKVVRGWKPNGRGSTDRDVQEGVEGLNYYNVFNGGSCNNTPFTLIFDEKQYYGKSFRFTMRLYVDMSNCYGDFDSEAKMNFRTSFGNDAALYVDMDMYDVYNQSRLLKSYHVGPKYTHVDNDLKVGGDLNSFYRQGVRVVRMEFTFYGTFRTNNPGTQLMIYPEFQQWKSCAQVAVDYISGEAANVCLEHGAVCTGEMAHVNAAGFPKGAYYKWEKLDPRTNIWSPMDANGFNGQYDGKQSIDVLVDYVGTRKYRVSDSNSNMQPLEFTITGENCEPLQPSDIEGPEGLCVPNSAEQGKFSVYPLDANELVRYTWKFITPSGAEFGSDRISFSGGKLDTVRRGGSIYLVLDGTAEEGVYTAIVQPVKTAYGQDGQPYEQLAGDPIKKTFTVYRTPQIQVIKEGTDPLKQDEVLLCATDRSQKIVAIADVKSGFSSIHEGKYVYTWKYGAKGKTFESVVDFPDMGSCDGSYKEHSARVDVEISGVGCKASAETSWKLAPIEKPTIKCPVNNSLTYTLGTTQKEYSIRWDFPEYTAGCETNPTLKVDLNFTPKVGSKITNNVITSRNEINSLTKIFSLPAGEGTITYSVVDGCGNEAKCQMLITVKDVTPPSLPCDEIPHYKTKLTLQEGCDAAPEYDHSTLPTIVPPVLRDLNGVDGEVVGQYRGRVANPATIPTPQSFDESMFDVKVDMNENYVVGDTYILWAFSDASGNTAYCIQIVSVEDDRKPNVNCIDPNIGYVKSLEGECGLSVTGLFSQMKEIPTGKDVCSGEGQDLTAEIYYRNALDDDFIHVPLSDFEKIIFYVGESYDVIWRFFKIKNAAIYEDCIGQISVQDSEPPHFDCSTLPSIRVTANSFKPENKGYVYLDYATKADVKQGKDTYRGTLAEIFENNDIRLIDPSELIDNCHGDVTIITTLTGPSDPTGKEKTETITSLKQLEDHKYYVGLTTINYQFIDEHGNSSSCAQTIIVTAGTTPIPDCPSTADTTVYVDEQCKTEFVLTKAQVPTAKIPVNQEGAWFQMSHNSVSSLHLKSGDCTELANYYPDNINNLSGVHPLQNQPGPALPGGPTPGGSQEFTIEYLCDQYMNNWDKFNGNNGNNFWRVWSSNFDANNQDKILIKSNSLTTVVEYTGYPYEVELLDPDGVSIVKVENPYEEDDKAATRVLAPRFYDQGGRGTECKELSHVCEYADVKLQNHFNDQIIKESLSKGDYRLVYRFQNEKGGIQIDSCVIFVHVSDSIPPVLECGDWNKSGEFVAGPDCRVPVDSVPWFKKPTAVDLNTKDNCTTDIDKFKISWKRSWESYKDIAIDAALTDAFLIGVTTMKWIVTDESGNSSYCEQTITVVDKTGPYVDCSKLTTIYAETEENCEASAESVIRAGLSTPYADDDVCSPTGGRIPGEGVRDDGKDVFTDPYPRGTTTITWTFKDSLDNISTCTQKVVVTDHTNPVFDKCDEMEDVTIVLEPDECTASKDVVEAALGSFTAIDDCDGDVPGIPHVLLPDSTLADLYDSFIKDTTYIIVWTFTDLSGNSISCSHRLTIKDVTTPHVDEVCKDPETDVDATVTCSVDYDELHLPDISEMILNDKCDGPLTPQMVAKIAQPDFSYMSYEDEELKTITYPVTAIGYPHKIWWIYTDKAGNKDTCQMLININDKTLPVLEDCDVDPVIHLTVDGDICAMTPANVKPYVVEPKAHDECDDYLSQQGLTWMTPVVQRFYIDSTLVLGTLGDTLGYNYDTTMVADGITKMWDEDVFPKGTTMMRWIFTDHSGNSVSCEKSIIIHDYTPPYFDCDEIQPDTLRPEAHKGECQVEFGNLKREVLDKLGYTAWDACAGDSVPGLLTIDGMLELPEEYTMSVGVTYKLLWLFQDADKNRTTCPQYILPSHVNDINFDCNTIKDTSVFAAAGECSISADSLKLPTPVAIDSCAELSGLGGEFPAIGYRSDSLSMTAPFPTGNTLVKWMFVSPWNLHDTLWCEQNVFVKGNKHFDLDCETLTPNKLEILSDCGPTDPEKFAIDTPRVADPCVVDENNPEYWRYGKGTRSDAKDLTEPFSLGLTNIQWIFTDFTDAIHDTCSQDIYIRTSLDMIFDCDSLTADTIKIDAVEGECTVDASLVKDKIKTPFALHPCPTESGVDTIWGTPERRFGTPMDSSYYVGLTEIIWTFIDTSATLVHDTMTCSQWIQVGDVNQMPVKCENYPDMVYRLNPNDCEISWKDLNLNIPPVVDLCSHKIIDPVVTRSSGKNLTLVTTITGTDTTVVIDADEFSVGVDTLVWTYSFQGQLFVCDQIITVKDSMQPIFDCSSLTALEVFVSGTCEAPASTVVDSLPNPWPAAEEQCTKQLIPGRVYLEDGRELDPTSKFTVAVGSHRLTWIFIDTVINEIGDTCYQDLVIKSDFKPIINCDTLPLDTFITYNCDTILSQSSIRIPVALDSCTKDTIYGTGTRSDGKRLYDDPYSVGTTIISWMFVSPYSTEVSICTQPIVVLTQKEPEFNCDDLDTIRVASEPGECFAALTAIIDKLPDPIATEACTGNKIHGKYSAEDGGPLPDKFIVGDTTYIKWTFMDSAYNAVPKICYQPVLVTGDQKPLFDCDTFSHDTIIIEGCDTTLDAQTIHTPIALDACTGDTVYGIGERLNGEPLYGVYPVGTTTIRWKFISPFSSVSDSCDQQITLLTTKEIDFNCEDLKPDSINVEKGECSVLVELPTQWAKHPCPEQSGVSKIIGVPSLGTDTFTLNEDSTKWSKIVPTGVWTIQWTFTDTSNTLENSVKKCDQLLFIGDVNDMPVKCDNYPDTIIVLPPTDCEISWSMIGFVDSVVIDLCSGDTVNPVYTRWSGKTMSDPFIVGIDTIYRSYSYEGQNVVCKQRIDVLDSVAPYFNCDTLKPIEIVAPKGKCEITSDLLEDSLGVWYAVDSCTSAQVLGVAYVDGIEVKNVSAHVGDTLNVHWIFKDSTLNAVAKECDQLVTVVGQSEPLFDCNLLEDLTYKIHVGDCAFPGDSLNLTIPIALDSCTNTEVEGVASRQDGLSMSDSFAVGETMIDWTFKSPYSINPKICSQKIVVEDKNAPTPDCDALPDTIRVRITDESKFETEITYEELLKAKDFVIPTVDDPCDGLITAVGVREDGKQMEDNYPLGIIDINWIYTDKSGNSDTCHQVIEVEDYLIDTLYCPSGWNHKTISCADELPKVYETYQEFVSAGGSFSNPAKVNESTFRMTESFTGTQYCDETYYRTYHVTDVRSNDISCTDTVYVKDTQAPVFTNLLRDITIACTDSIPDPAKVEVTDCDPNPVVTMKEVSHQGTNPSQCDYYTYDIDRTWVAVDRCGNRDTMVQIIHVVDTIGPSFDFPEDWKEEVLSIYRKGCLFEVPDFSVTARAIATDNCSDVNNLFIEQTPKAGEYITKTSDVIVKVSDMCGNSDSFTVSVYVPLRESITSIYAYDTTTCVSDNHVLNLNTQKTRYAKGRYLIEDPFDNSYYYVESTFYYDIFRGHISDSTVVYSSNPYTYLIDENQKTELAPLTRHASSDRYYFVAYDTLTLCSDTSSAMIRLKERPRISLESTSYDVCELVHIDSTMLYDYLQCTDNMGGDTVLSEGWLYAGEKFDLEKDTIPYSSKNYSFVYYMENECGMSTSLDSYAEFCGTELETRQDSIDYVGGKENLQLLKDDKFVKSDSITMYVHQRFLPKNIIITTEPHDPSRIWLGEIVELQLHTDYDYTTLTWHKVVGEYDRKDVIVGKDEKEFEFIPENDDEVDEILYIAGRNSNQIIQDSPKDTTIYYVTLSDGVCPSVASDLAQVNVITKLPTAFTPYDKDGLNDTFMERHYVVIYDRYGQKVFEGSNGWDGTHQGQMADPGVYYYLVTMTDGSLQKGTIEIIYLNK